MTNSLKYLNNKLHLSPVIIMTGGKLRLHRVRADDFLALTINPLKPTSILCSRRNNIVQSDSRSYHYALNSFCTNGVLPPCTVPSYRTCLNTSLTC